MRLRLPTTLLFSLIIGGLLAAWAGGAFAASSVSRAQASTPTTVYPIAEASIGCNSKDEHAIDNGKQGTPGKLVPTGAESLQLCLYNGGNKTKLTPAFGLVSVGAAGHKAATRLTSELDALKRGHGTYNCPDDTGAAVIAEFEYSSGAAYKVKIGLSGCNVITNGKLSRLGLDKPFISAVAKIASELVAHPVKIQGHVRWCGGPSPGRCGSYTNVKANRVFAYDAAGKREAAGTVTKGRFSFEVPQPGHYTLKLRENNMQHRHFADPLHVLAKLGRTTHAVFTVPVP